MEARENAGLVLRTYDIQTFLAQADYNAVLANADNEIGTIESNGQYLVFKNINMRLVLGTLWDKYDMFNICLRTVALSHNQNAINGMCCSIWMSGLNWVNQSYSVRTKTMVNECCIGGNNYVATNANGGVNHFPANSAMFRKGKEVTDLSIELRNSVGGNPVNGADGRLEKILADLGHQQYIFDFYGVDGYETTRQEIKLDYSMSYDRNKNERLNAPNYVINNKLFR
jgi:hypothetical protein